MLQCPVCGSQQLEKKLSAPRLNLSGASSDVQPMSGEQAMVALKSAWVAFSREVAARTEDVGDQFAEQARKMHYGEIDERAIRGRASLEQARELADEGIDLMPLALPDDQGSTLH
jgi:hypothetical protein